MCLTALLYKFTDTDFQRMRELLSPIGVQSQEHIGNGIGSALSKEVMGVTSLMLAAYYDTAEAVQCLVERGNAELEAKFKGGTALCFAILSEREDASVVRVLIEAGADIHVLVMRSLTPLMMAAYAPKTPEKAIALIEAGANINERHDGRDALMKAVIVGRFETAKVLLAAGADPEVLLKTCELQQRWRGKL